MLKLGQAAGSLQLITPDTFDTFYYADFSDEIRDLLDSDPLTQADFEDLKEDDDFDRLVAEQFAKAGIPLPAHRATGLTTSTSAVADMGAVSPSSEARDPAADEVQAGRGAPAASIDVADPTWKKAVRVAESDDEAEDDFQEEDDNGERDLHVS